MLYRDVSRIVGYYLLLLGGALMIPFCISLFYQWQNDPISHPQPYVTKDFLFAILVNFALSALLILWGRKSSGSIYRKEGLAAVVFIWLLTPAISALPFLTSGTLHNFWQAYFEMASGYTTTGSTVFSPKKYDAKTGQEVPIKTFVRGDLDTIYTFYGTIKPIRDPNTGQILKEGVEAVEKSLLFWRSFTQWLGGVGIVVLFVAVLPLFGVGGKLLFQAEVTGPNKGAVTPRIKETALNLWKIYLFLTGLELITLLLLDQKMPLFDAVTITLSNISTGGFSIRNESIAAYRSASVEWTVLIFMLLGSINFSLYYYVARGKFYRFYETEFGLFLALALGLSLLVSWQIVGSNKISLTGVFEGKFQIGEAIRHGFFQTISALSSTGFTTIQYNYWPFAAQGILWLAMFFGGMSGSTAGGIKTLRLYMLFRLAQYKIEAIFRPENVRLFRVENFEVSWDTALTVLCFFLIVVSSAALGTLAYIFDGIDFETSLGLVACMLNNTGLSFRAAGPDLSCAFLSNFSLGLSSLMMILGRLEYYALLAFLVPAFWHKN